MNYPGTLLSAIPRELRQEVYNRLCEVTWLWDGESSIGYLTIDDGNKEYVIPVNVRGERGIANLFLYYMEQGYVSWWKPNPQTTITYKPRKRVLVIDDGKQVNEIRYCPKIVNAVREIAKLLDPE